MGQHHVFTFRHAQRAAYRTAISAAQTCYVRVDPPEKSFPSRPAFQGQSILSEPTRIDPPPMTSY